MKKITLLFVTLIVVLMAEANAQRNADIELKYDAADTSTSMVWANAGFAWQFPFGTLKETFKMNAQVHVNLTYKFASNWTIDMGFAYMFGGKVRNMMDILGSDLLTSNGDLIDGNGTKATIHLDGRYWTLGLGVGKIIPFDKWRNSGLWLKMSGGYFSHKVNISIGDQTNQNEIPQLAGDYKKGYDQRAGGFCLSQFVGYIFMRKVRVRSFYAGVEVTEIWAKPNRNYQFLLMGPPEQKAKFSLLLGLKVGWVVPFYEKRKIQTLYRY